MAVVTQLLFLSEKTNMSESNFLFIRSFPIPSEHVNDLIQCLRHGIPEALKHHSSPEGEIILEFSPVRVVIEKCENNHAVALEANVDFLKTGEQHTAISVLEGVYDAIDHFCRKNELFITPTVPLAECLNNNPETERTFCVRSPVELIDLLHFLDDWALRGKTYDIFGMKYPLIVDIDYRDDGVVLRKLKMPAAFKCIEEKIPFYAGKWEIRTIQVPTNKSDAIIRDLLKWDTRFNHEAATRPEIDVLRSQNMTVRAVDCGEFVEWKIFADVGHGPNRFGEMWILYDKLSSAVKDFHPLAKMVDGDSDIREVTNMTEFLDLQGFWMGDGMPRPDSVQFPCYIVQGHASHESVITYFRKPK